MHDLRMKRFADFSIKYHSLLSAPTFSSDATARKFLEEAPSKIQEVLSIKEAKERKAKAREVFAPVHKAFSLREDAIFGTLNENALYKSLAKKALITHGDGSDMPVLASFRSMVPDAEIDLQYLLIYEQDDLRNALVGKVIDYRTEVKVKKTPKGAPIEYTPLGFDKALELESDRYTNGIAFDRRWINNNAAVNMNDAITAQRMAFERNRSYEAWQNVFNSTDGSPFAFDTSVVKTISRGAFAVLDQNRIDPGSPDAGKGYDVTTDTVVYLVVNPLYMDIVNQAINAVRGENGTNPVIEYNVQPIFSFHAPLEPVSGKAGGYLVLPKRKHRMGIFDDLFSEEEYKFSTDTVNLGAQEYVRFKSFDTKQVKKVNFVV